MRSTAYMIKYRKAGHKSKFKPLGSSEGILTEWSGLSFPLVARERHYNEWNNPNNPILLPAWHQYEARLSIQWCSNCSAHKIHSESLFKRKILIKTLISEKWNTSLVTENHQEICIFLQMQFLQNYKSRIKSLCRSCLLNDTFFWPLFCLFSVPLVYLVQNTESETLSSLRSWTWSYFLCINPEYTAQWCQTKTSKLNETDVKHK